MMKILENMLWITYLDYVSGYYPGLVAELKSLKSIFGTISYNADVFWYKSKFENHFEKHCNLDNLKTYAAIALKCFPYHLGFFDYTVFK